jgi:hypothetical protein
MKNEFKVNKKTWRKWSDVAQHVFNETYSTMKTEPWVFWPSLKKTNKNGLPKQIKSRTWRVVSWNTAWIAADACNAKVETPLTQKKDGFVELKIKGLKADVKKLDNYCLAYRITSRKGDKCTKKSVKK